MKLHEITVAEEAARCLLCYDAPCSKACPSASDPAAFIMAIRFENSAGGARKAIENNLFSGICAAACPSSNYCAGACIRGKIDRPVDISLLHGYIAQKAAENEFLIEKSDTLTGTKVLVLGGNMAGLSAAAELAKSGAAVTVCADGPLFGAQLLGQLKEAGVDTALLENAQQSLKRLDVTFVESSKGPLAGDFDVTVVASKKSLASCLPEGYLPEGSRKTGNGSAVFFTGELLPGPDDAAYSVKKGKDAARRVFAYAGSRADTLEKEAGQ
jgi:dihydropyrimidine dehydrogenase (NAD+) subunit PreT